MSGLEPLAALGLVCNVLQLVEVGVKTAALCKNAYRTGEPDPELGVYTQNLAETASNLSQALEISPKPLNVDESRLLVLARRCRDAEAEWRKRTPAQFLSQQQPRKRDRFGAVFRGIINKPEIDRLESQLQKAKESLETDLLVGVFKRLEIFKVQADDLQETLQHLLRVTSAGETKLHNLVQEQVALFNTQLSDRIVRAESSTKAHFTSELGSHESRIISNAKKVKDSLLTEAEAREASRRENEAYERLLRSFHYPDMNHRKNEIHSSHASTFHWIFEGGSLDVRHPKPRPDIASYPDAEGLVCSSFARWLKSAESRYWISGRPGSGKSVLMKFIVSHEQTITSLRQWQPEVRIIAHFFWKVGSPMQRSFKGFLCSLVYELFSSDKGHAMSCLKQNPDWSRKAGPGDWDKEDLKFLLHSYTRQPAQPFCLFIDGIDELTDDEGVGILFDFLDTLQEPPHLVKVCMSSRPEHAIRMRLPHEPDLKMQDLTLNDIRSYSRAILSKEIALRSSPIDVEAVVGDVSAKAEGVFLWAVLVTRSIARGISNGDSEDEIHKRLSKAPKQLYGLYVDMWTRLGEDSDLYQSLTALILKILLFTWLPPQKAPSDFPRPTWEHSILDLMLASNDDLWSTPVSHFDKLSDADLEQRCNELFTRLPVRTADLFEIREYMDPFEELSADKPHYCLIRYYNMKVAAIHRTVFDFLIETEDGNKLTEHHKGSETELFVIKFRSCLLRDYLRRKVEGDRAGFEMGFNKDDCGWSFAGSLLTSQLLKLSLHAENFHDSVLFEMLDLVWASFVQITKSFPPQSHRIANRRIPRCKLDYLLRLASLGFDSYLKHDIIEWENTRQFEVLQKVITACLLSHGRQYTDFECAGRQRLLERILWIFLSANGYFVSPPKGFHLSNNTLVKASIAYFVTSTINTFQVSRSITLYPYLWESHRSEAVLKMNRDFRQALSPIPKMIRDFWQTLCLGDHMLLTLYPYSYSSRPRSPEFISCIRHPRDDTVIYVEISMSILIQMLLQQVATIDATFNRHDFESTLDLKAFPQTIRPAMLGVVGGYFHELSSTDLPIFQRYCQRRLLPELFGPSIEDLEDLKWCGERLAEAEDDIIKREGHARTRVETTNGIEEGIGPNGMNYYLCSSCEVRETA